jgi:hypothetical protein
VLFLGEDGSEVAWVCQGEVTISPFVVDVPTSSESIGFCAQFSGSESNDHVELGKEFRPSSLTPSK